MPITTMPPSVGVPASAGPKYSDAPGVAEPWPSLSAATSSVPDAVSLLEQPAAAREMAAAKAIPARAARRGRVNDWFRMVLLLVRARQVSGRAPYRIVQNTMWPEAQSAIVKNS